MIRLALHQLWGRRLQALAPLVALLLATIGFQAVLLSARVTQSHVQGVIAANWNPPYDLLARPSSLVTGVNSDDRLLQPNYLESAHGGISTQQVTSVRGVSGVTLAAPAGVVVVDFLYAIDYKVDLAQLPRTDKLSIYRFSTSFTTDGGSSHVPGRTIYALVQGNGPAFVRSPETSYTGELLSVDGHTFECGEIECFAPPAQLPPLPFARLPYQPLYSGTLHPYENTITVPVVAVDPVAENRLFGVENCLTAGRNLQTGDGVARGLDVSQAHPDTIPVVMNSTPGFDDTAHAIVEAADNPYGKLASQIPVLPRSNTVYNSTELPTTLVEQLLTFHQVAQSSVSLNAAWSGAGGLGIVSGGPLFPAWNEAQDTVTSTEYTGKPPRLRAKSVHQEAVDPNAINLNSQLGTNEFNFNPVDEGVDTAFRALKRLTEASGAFAIKNPWHGFNIVGKYSADCISSKSALSRSGFDIYSYPRTVMPSGKVMRPNASISNFVAPMPLLMTNLAGGAYFSDQHRFANGSGDAFLSVIRVRVGGTDVPGLQSQRRLERVAAEIHKQTGLAVDIIKGSSTETMSIQLAGGVFGRPPMTVEQDWLAENVGITFFNAINRTTVVMSVVVAVVAGLLTMQATYATVRRRRGELVLLRAIGWPSWRIAALMELEVVSLGVVVAAVALVVAAAMILFEHPGSAVVAGLLLAAPAAIAITALAGAGPALTASRTRPLAALRGPGRIRHRRRILARPVGLGIREALTTWRWQTLLGALATAVGALFLGAVLAISQGFHASLDSTALAQQLASEVGPFDILLGVLAVALGAGTAVSVVLVATRERLPHFATLRALGWSRRQVGAVVAAQAMTVGLLGGVLGVAALAAVGSRIHEGITLTPLNVLSPLALGIATGVVAALAALRLVYARVAVSVLRVG